MSWLVSLAVALVSACVGCAGSVGIGLLCVGWYRVPQREGAAGYFVVFAGLVGLVVGGVIGLVAARVSQGVWGPGFVREGSAALGVLAVVLAVVLGVCWARAGGPVEGRSGGGGEGMEFVVEVRLPAGVTEFPVKDAAEAYLGLAVVEGRTRVQGEERAGELEVGRARLDQGRWLVPGRAGLAAAKGEVVMTVKVGSGAAERYLVPLTARVREGWSDWIPRSRGEGAGGVMTFRYRVGPKGEGRSGGRRP